jgi:Cu(I)/Ag(I) efflux system periplasmic protein CusF
MNLSKKFAHLAIAAFSLGALPPAHANPPPTEQSTKDQTPAAATMADAEVRKIDAENLKITLKHGEIKNLDMPSMTMVFQIKEAALLKDVKVGDKIKFTAEKQGRNYVVTDIQIVK